MKSLKFEPNLIPAILSGDKNVTWRLFDDKALKVGDNLSLVDSKTGKAFAKALIESIIEKTLCDIEEADYDGHEKYNSKEDMLDIYKSYYGDTVTEDTKVKIVKFVLI